MDTACVCVREIRGRAIIVFTVLKENLGCQVGPKFTKMTDNRTHGFLSIRKQNSSPHYRISAIVLTRTTWKICWTAVQKSLKCSFFLRTKIKNQTFFLWMILVLLLRKPMIGISFIWFISMEKSGLLRNMFGCLSFQMPDQNILRRNAHNYYNI